MNTILAPKSGLNGESKKGMPQLPAGLKNMAIVDAINKIAYCVKDIDKELQRDFLNYHSKLKSMGVVTSYKVVTANELHKVKKTVLKSNKDAIKSDMQNMAANFFKDAAKRGVSDIHIIDRGTHGDVFFRINGLLTFIQDLPAEVPHLLFSAVYTSMTDIAEPTYKKDQPQKARIAERKFLPENVTSVRVGSSPASEGSFMVFRLLYKSEPIPFEKIGYSVEQGQQDNIRLMQAKNSGLIILAGSTGSGKSTSLMHILTDLKKNNPFENFMSVEDPPEYPMPGVLQIPVIVDAKATDDQKRQAYNNVLDAMLRLDPDQMMIGEIRDKSSAQLALQGAMTGHLVWTTLHANNSFNIITRLINKLDHPNAMKEVVDIGILNGLIYQQLVPTLCPHCKITGDNEAFEQTIDLGAYKRLQEKVKFNISTITGLAVKGPGCKHCYNTGIGGRRLLAETVCLDYNLIEKIHEVGVGGARRHWIKNGGKTIVDHAVEVILEGVVDPIMAEKAVGPLTLDKALSDSKLEAKEIADLTE